MRVTSPSPRSIGTSSTSVDVWVRQASESRPEVTRPMLDKGRTDDLPDHIRSGAARRRSAFSHWVVIGGVGTESSAPELAGCTARVSECARTTVGIVRSRRHWRDGAEDQDATAKPVRGVRFPPLAQSGFRTGLAGRHLAPLDRRAAERRRLCARQCLFEMRVGPSEPACGGRLQTTGSGLGQEPWS
jgi:hypothetical protein